jgi:ATP-binding cassette subfamily C protein
MSVDPRRAERGSSAGDGRPIWRAIHACWRLLPQRRRLQWALVVPLSALGAALEVVGALAVLVLVRALAAPEPAGRVAAAAVGGAETGSVVGFAGLWGEIGALLGRRGGELVAGDSAIALAAVVLGFYAAKNLALAGVAWYASTVAQRSSAELSVLLLDAYLATPYARHATSHSAERLQRLTSAARQAVEGALSGAGALLSELLVALGLLAVVAWAAPLPTLLAAALLGALLAVVLVLARRRFHDLGARQQALEHDTLRVAQDALAGFAEVRAYGLADTVHDLFAARRHRLASVRVVLSLLEATPRLLIETVFVVGVLVVVASRDGTAADQRLATLGLLAYAGFRLIPSINRILLHSSSVLFARAAIDAIEHDLAEAVVPSRGAPAPAERHERLELRARLRFEGVGYAYPGRSPALEAIDLELARGECLGVCGPTGSGKTTLLALVLGLVEPTAGRILIDGEPLRGSLLDAWRRGLGYVPQEVFLIDDTLRRNIAFGVAHGEVDEESLRRAIADAQLEDLVALLPAGLESGLGERGVMLSGGQRQRVAIARALYRQPSLLLFDEATAHLDPDTERRILAALAALKGRVTMILVAHRPEALALCDRVVRLESGRIVTRGPLAG